MNISRLLLITLVSCLLTANVYGLSPKTRMDPLYPLYEDIVYEVEKSDIKPFIVGIAGGSGVGKSTLAERMKKELQRRGKTVFVLHMDEFFVHPWERWRLQGSGNEWGPEHVRIDELKRVLKGLKKRMKRIETHYAGRAQLLPMNIVNIRKIDIILFEGVWAISSDPEVGKLIDFIDFPVYLDADENMQFIWRFKRQNKKKKPRNYEDFKKHWDLGIQPDNETYVKPSKINAKYVIEVNAERKISLIKKIRINFYQASRRRQILDPKTALMNRIKSKVDQAI